MAGVCDGLECEPLIGFPGALSLSEAGIFSRNLAEQRSRKQRTSNNQLLSTDSHPFKVNSKHLHICDAFPPRSRRKTPRRPGKMSLAPRQSPNRSTTFKPSETAISKGSFVACRVVSLRLTKSPFTSYLLKQKP